MKPEIIERLEAARDEYLGETGQAPGSASIGWGEFTLLRQVTIRDRDWWGIHAPLHCGDQWEAAGMKIFVVNEASWLQVDHRS